jgi:hypothetical protein
VLTIGRDGDTIVITRLDRLGPLPAPPDHPYGHPWLPESGFGEYRQPSVSDTNTGATPVSSITRSESALLVGSMIRASTMAERLIAVGGAVEPEHLVAAA